MADANEPAVKQEEFLAQIRGYDPPQKLIRERDMIDGRYRIQVAQPIAGLSSPCAKAYVVSDAKATDAGLYALVFDNTVPVRYKNIQALKGFTHPNLVSLIEDGVADISILNEARYVVILERPSGQPLSQLLAQGKNPVSEGTLVQQLLRPLIEILAAFAGMGISHNSINLKNVYLGNNGILLGECISEPSGFSQDPIFEPIDRILTSPWAKPDYAINADCYAIAILSLHLILGFQPFRDWSREQVIDELLNKGSYHAFAIQWDLSDTMQDFFRGLLNEAHRERWDPKIIETWLGGKRFNIIMPSLPKETSRGFDFMGQTYFNRKALAQGLFTFWQDARLLLFDNKLVRWIETSIHKPEVSGAIARVSSNNQGDNARAERHNNDLLSRVITLLDPFGPIRLKNLSVTADGLGTLLAHALLTGKNEDVQTILQIIDADLPAFWIELQKNDYDYNALNAKLQKTRMYARMTGLGFGIERCVYEFHPTLACQSPLVKRFYVTDLKELLLALNSIAAQRASQEDFMDRHIGAFIASKLEIAKDIRIHELDGIPGLSGNSKFIALKLLVRAQQKAGNVALRGLSHWIAYQLFPLIDAIHNRTQRRKLQLNLKAAAERGSLQEIASLMLNPHLFVSDYRDFQKITHSYAKHMQSIEDLKNHKFLAQHARVAGRGFAQTIAYAIGVATIYCTLRVYFHF